MQPSKDFKESTEQTPLHWKKSLDQHFLQVENQVKKILITGKNQIASKEELADILLNIQEFREEIQKIFSAPKIIEMEKEKKSFPSMFEIFNLRKRYHNLSLELRSEEVDPFGFDPIFDQFIRPFLEYLYTKYWRVETYGMAHVPSQGPVLLVGNHSGSLPYDALMLKTAVQKEHHMHRELRFLVEDFLFHFPFLGSLMNRGGGVRASQENAQQLLSQNHPVVVFPEGVKGLGKLYKDKYHLARFGRGGFVRLCLKTRAPMNPVVFIGPEEIHPMIAKETFFAQALGVPYLPITWTFPWLGPLGAIPLPSKWQIHILPTIDFSQYGPDAEKDRVLVHKMSLMVKEQIQDTIIEKIKHRRSIWS